ncbi:hypothetical protein LCGC14_0665190 [marine sediment metagenome]|uniref:Uncharacterized protein n=1 Tax=marine sediment metagenome TaxID=412755 RepID=A0A0F9U0J4_9ZZZZ
MGEVRGDILMECGHTNNGAYTMNPWPATRGNGEDEGGATLGDPVCGICVGINPGATRVAATKPDLNGRVAICSSCGKGEQPSDWKLPFFEHRGPGSIWAATHCRYCGGTDTEWHSRGHYAPHPGTGVEGEAVPWDSSRCVTAEFTPKEGLDHDYYYCGCRGWD